MTTTRVAPASGQVGHFRWVVCTLLFFSVTINYLDRQLLSILKKPLSDNLGWSDADYGWIAAAFSFAYAFGYLVAGRAMDRIGVKRGLPLVVFLWSTAAVAHGFCAYIDVTERFSMRYPWFSWAEKGFVVLTLAVPMTAAGFMLARIALGLTQGGIFPGAIKAVAEWYPPRERALATGLFNAGTNFGAILCLLVVPWIYARLGWEKTFYVTGATGYLWLIAWWLLYERPEKHERVSAAELAYIHGGEAAPV
jgi:ACS family hexuronate transporter-like MFS transporter